MFSRYIYFYKLLYMFQSVSSPIIRSTKLYIQRQVLFKPILLPAAIVDEMELMEFHLIHDSSSIGLTIPDAVCTIFAPHDGQTNRLKYVEQFIEINRSRKRCILLVVL